MNTKDLGTSSGSLADGEPRLAGTAQVGHTPGPWNAEVYGSPMVWAEDRKGSFPICDLRGWGHLTGKGHGALGLDDATAIAIQNANARLIAAAPDMLAALREIDEYAWSAVTFDCEEACDGLRGRVAKARAAIAKATGAVESALAEGAPA